MISLELTSRCQLLAIGETIDFKKNPMVNPMMAPIHSNENCSPDAYTENVLKLLGSLSVYAAHWIYSIKFLFLALLAILPLCP